MRRRRAECAWRPKRASGRRTRRHSPADDRCGRTRRRVPGPSRSRRWRSTGASAVGSGMPRWPGAVSDSSLDRMQLQHARDVVHAWQRDGFARRAGGAKQRARVPLAAEGQREQHHPRGGERRQRQDVPSDGHRGGAALRRIERIAQREHAVAHRALGVVKGRPGQCVLRAHRIVGHVTMLAQWPARAAAPVLIRSLIMALRHFSRLT